MARFLLQGVKHKITGYNSWLNEFGAMNPKEHSTLNDKILDIRETEKTNESFASHTIFLSHGELKVDCKWTNNKLIYSISNDISPHFKLVCVYPCLLNNTIMSEHVEFYLFEPKYCFLVPRVILHIDNLNNLNTNSNFNILRCSYGIIQQIFIFRYAKNLLISKQH